MQRRNRPKPEIIEYAQLKTAAGGEGRGGGGTGGGVSGGGGGADFRAGDNIVCQVIKQEQGGYSVMILKHNVEAFLPTQAPLRPGEEIHAQFVCVHKNRILISAGFSNNGGSKS